jgi:predicted dinucleotide-binding enzyme
MIPMMEVMMKIAVIGMGSVGGTLGRRWAEAGHEVTFGVRNPGAPKAAAEAGGARLATVADAAADAEVATLAVPWGEVKDAIASAGDLAGKVVLDCTNPLSPDLSGLEIGHTTSGAEEVAKLAPGARVVKIFNTTGSNNMDDPDYGGTPATMLYAGDDTEAKSIAAALARDLGFDPIDLGSLAAARLLEPMALAWIRLALRQGLGRDFVLQVVRRPARA